MSNQGFLNVSELSFDGIKNNLKTYLRARPEFTDYDFEGSNLSALLDVLSYNTYINAYYLNMIGSESFLDSAQVKSSVVSHAKELNYVPRSRTSPRSQVTFTINTGADTPKTVIIPEFFTVKATVNNVSMDFSTDSAITVYQNASGAYQSDSVFVYEGKIVTEIFNYPSDKNFVLSSSNIDISSIKVQVINSITDNTTNAFYFADSLVGLTPLSQVYFIQGVNSDQYEIVFGDGVVGQALSPGNIVQVMYRSTNGELGNKVYSFSSPNKIGNYSVAVSTNLAAAHGSERENIDSIKFYAPRHFTTQNRAVTKDDYINLVREKYPEISAINVYGGEDADPPQYGKALISMVASGNNPIIPDDLKTNIIEYLKTKSLTIAPVIVDPVFLFVEINADVYYNPTLTSKTAQQLKSDVLNQIISFDTLNLTDFGNDLRRSKLSTYIDASDTSIVSNNLDLRAVYKITPTRTVKDSVIFSFDNPINRPIKYAYNSNETEVIRSSTFYYNFNNTIINNARLTDDGEGNLRIYYSTPSQPVIILNSNVGTVDYATGKMNFNINAWDYNQSINIYAKFLNPDIIVNANKYLKIDYSKININIDVYSY
jgi:hypothetical protein